MRLALLGSGKTGNFVKQLHPEVMCFNRSHKISLSALESIDVLIAFLPMDAFINYLPILEQANIDIICGATGAQAPFIKNPTARWVFSHNFSLGITLVKAALQALGERVSINENASFVIQESHHAQKLDSPSGTALSMQEWFGHKCLIEATRQGDIVGEHSLSIETDHEKITLSHSAKDRGLFAKGALWSAEKVFHSQLAPGTYPFSQIVDKYLKGEL